MERIADQQDRIEALEKKVANYENLEKEMAALKKSLEEKQDQKYKVDCGLRYQK